MSKGNLSLLSMRPLSWRIARVVLGIAAVAAPCMSVSTAARADGAASYPGGCLVVFEVTVPTSCSYTNLGGDSELLTYEGNGSVTISGCQASTTYTGTPNRVSTFNISGQGGGQLCQVQLNGTGIADIVDTTHAWGVCAAFSFGAPLDPATCPYVALTTVGLAVGQVEGTSDSALTITVQDTTRGTTVASCSANGLAIVTEDCPYTENVGDAYTVTMTATGGGQVDFLTAGR